MQRGRRAGSPAATGPSIDTLPRCWKAARRAARRHAGDLAAHQLERDFTAIVTASKDRSPTPG